MIVKSIRQLIPDISVVSQDETSRRNTSTHSILLTATFGSLNTSTSNSTIAFSYALTIGIARSTTVSRTPCNNNPASLLARIMVRGDCSRSNNG